MKNLTICFTVLLLITFFTNSFSQTRKPKCNVGAWMDEHTTDQRWNDLIDMACRQINEGKYSEAYQTLLNARTLDSLNSVSSNGVMNELIGGQLNKLSAYLSDSASDEEGGNPVPVAPEPTPLAESIPLKAKIDKPAPENPPVQGGNPNEKPALEIQGDAIESKGKAAVVVATEIEPEEKTDNEATKSFSEEELKDFKDQGFQKLMLLENYIRDIANKSNPSGLVNKTIENATLLFSSEDHTVQVSSINNNEKKTYPVRKYLQRIQLLNYDKIDIEWAVFEYASEFKLGYDNNYHGYITFHQKFTGTKDLIPVYKDETTKKIEVIIKKYDKGAEGSKWQIFLGDLSVVQTESR